MMDCYLCGRPAIGECQRCGNPYCAAHGDGLCSRCLAPSGGLASPVLYKSALVVLILAIASGGWFVYKWPWPLFRDKQSLATGPIEARPAPTIMASEPTPIQTPTATPEAAAMASIQHVVEQGDNLGYIAAKYDTTVEAIAALNGLSEPYALQIGQVLLIPATTPTPVLYPTAIPAGLRAHTVQQGETLLDIAVKYDTTVEVIASQNALSDPYPLQTGQVLLIPVTVTTPTPVAFPTATPAGLRTHTVQQGETLLDIALKYDTTVEAIASQNGLSDPYPLQIGQVLLIPK